jgi:hypothetical protein
VTDNDVELVTDDSDLVYDGRARKRPPGAGGLVQELYVFLYNHPEGITLDDAHEELRDGWLYTDDYRAYQQDLERQRHSIQRARKGPPPVVYGTEEFKRRAQRWAIRAALRSMVRHGTAHRKDDRWYIGGRGPLIATIRNGLVALDPATRQAEEKVDRERHIRRETLRAEARQLADDKRNSLRMREFARRVESYLAGR